MIATPEQPFTENRRGLFSVAFRVLRNHEDAEDCLQEAMARIVRFWPDCDPETAASWAWTVVRNQALDTLRKRKSRKHGAHVALDEVLEPTMPSTRSKEREIIARLTIVRGTRGLTPREREAMALWMDGRRNAADIGAGMKSLEYRTIDKLRIRMSPKTNEAPVTPPAPPVDRRAALKAQVEQCRREGLIVDRSQTIAARTTPQETITPQAKEEILAGALMRCAARALRFAQTSVC